MTPTERPTWVRAFSAAAAVLAWLQVPIAVAAYLFVGDASVVVVVVSVAAAAAFLAVAVFVARWEDKTRTRS